MLFSDFILTKSKKMPIPVTPAKAGVHNRSKPLDPVFTGMTGVAYYGLLQDYQP
jgi:hypothetical protein